MTAFLGSWQFAGWKPSLVILLAAILFGLAAQRFLPGLQESASPEDDVRVHVLHSDLQAGPTEIKVLLPNPLAEDRRYPVVYVLPVEANDEQRYGNGLREMQKLDVHNRYGLICVAPTFAHLPWYADHPTDPRIRQETYFLREVLPFVEANYPAETDGHGRRLLGFSKSGWGAFSLLLRHPEVFGRAAAWDAPLNMEQMKFGSAPIFGTLANFGHYRVPELLKARAGQLGPEPRLALVGHANFGDDHQAVHELMLRLNILHEYRDEQVARHTWDAGWLPAAVEFLAR